LFIRRFKKDIKAQVRGSFPERTVHPGSIPASAAEEELTPASPDLHFSTDRPGTKDRRTSLQDALEKALFSSPAACIARSPTHQAHPRTHRSRDQYAADIEALEEPRRASLSASRPADFSKYQALCWKCCGPAPKRPSAGASRETDDRLVIFTERIPTLDWLASGCPWISG
jgi:hypothetical protein